jgi:hypothetical protein
MVPTVVWVFVAANGQPPKTLAEAAWRAALQRHLSPPVVRALTDRDVARAQVDAPPVAADAAASAATGATAAAAPPPPAGAPEKHDETWWRERMKNAKAALDRDEVVVTSLLSRLNALETDIVNRDDPAQRAALMAERDRTRLEWEAMQKQVVGDRDRITAVEQDARAQGVPPGWIR